MRNGLTIAHNRRFYQIEDSVRTKKVMVEERVDGSMRIMSGCEKLNYRESTERPRRKGHPCLSGRQVMAKRPR